MSEKVGSDQEQLWNWISKSIEDDVIEIQSRSMSDPPLSDIDFKSKIWVWDSIFRSVGPVYFGSFLVFLTRIFFLNSISILNQCWVVESLDLLEIIPTRWEWTWHLPFYSCSPFCTRELSVTWFVSNSPITQTFDLNSNTPIDISGTCLYNTIQWIATAVPPSGSANDESAAIWKSYW